MSEVDPLSRDRLIDALASGVSVSAAARSSGYSRAHAHRLMKDPEVQAEVDRRRAARTGEKSGDEEAALEVLRSLMNDEDQEPRDRIAAARAVLNHASAKRVTKLSAVTASGGWPGGGDQEGDRADRAKALEQGRALLRVVAERKAGA